MVSSKGGQWRFVSTAVYFPSYHTFFPSSSCVSSGRAKGRQTQRSESLKGGLGHFFPADGGGGVIIDLTPLPISEVLNPSPDEFAIY